MTDEIGYAEALAELETILAHLDRPDVDVDDLAHKVQRAAVLIRCAGNASRRRASTSTRWSPTSRRDRGTSRRQRVTNVCVRLLENEVVIVICFTAGSARSCA